MAPAFAVTWTLASCSAEPTSSATASPTNARTVHVEFPAFEGVVALQFSGPIDAARIDFFGS